MSREIPLVGDDGKLREEQLPKYLTAQEFDPKTDLVDLFEQAMNAGA